MEKIYKLTHNIGKQVEGMVQANVGQKLVKRNILRVFFVTNFVFVTLLLANMMLN